MKKRHKATVKSWKKDLESQVKKNFSLCKQIEKSKFNRAETCPSVVTISEDERVDPVDELDTSLLNLHLNKTCQDGDIISV